MGKKSNTGAWLVGGIAAIVILPKLLSTEGESKVPMVDLSGLFSGSLFGGNPLEAVTGDGGVTGEGGILETIIKTFTETIDRIVEVPAPTGDGDSGGNGGGNLIDEILARLGLGDGGGKDVVTAVTGGGESNTIPNIIRSVGEAATGVGIGSVAIVSSYLGAKALAPVVGTVGKVIAPIAGKAVAAGAGALAAPVSLSLGTILAVPAAGALGYWAGSEFNKTPAGQALIKWSGEQGAAVAQRQGWLATLLDWKVAGTTEYAQSIEVPANFATMTVAQRNAYFAKN